MVAERVRIGLEGVVKVLVDEDAVVRRLVGVDEEAGLAEGLGAFSASSGFDAGRVRFAGGAMMRTRDRR